MLKLVYTAAAIALAASATGVSFAQQPAAQAPAAKSATQGNLNEVICRKQEVTGSRLGSKKICRTRAEWADAQLQDRQELERVQARRGMKGQ